MSDAKRPHTELRSSLCTYRDETSELTYNSLIPTDSCQGACREFRECSLKVPHSLLPARLHVNSTTCSPDAAFIIEDAGPWLLVSAAV
jgi:hypothetical protein